MTEPDELGSAQQHNGGVSSMQEERSQATKSTKESASSTIAPAEATLEKLDRATAEKESTAETFKKEKTRLENAAKTATYKFSSLLPVVELET
ncbi:hypothetical protein V502_05580 [Pseudogymnoascus sp. VKM F-4520 (FW-2644)]|nr:hypothetical protein V502_05580 [Pseudogymnoascus sp. VKM F-4520 (FW-2644)]